jgi:simple sugar transport system permease protein
MTLARIPRVLLTIGIVVVALLLTTLVLWGTGNDVGAAWRALVEGSVGSRYAILSATLVRATPLILTGLAVAWAFSAGVFNIGVEGQFLVGAAAATAIGLHGPGPGALRLMLALLGGGLAGAGWAAIAGWLRTRFAVLEVISTIMLNFVALQLVAYLVHGPLGDPNGIYPQSPSLSRDVWLPRLFDAQRLHAGFPIAIASCLGLWFVLTRTASGFRLRLAGANPSAAWISGGVNVSRVTTGAFLVSGAIAGVAGAIEVTGVTFALYESISPGYGYTAIAVALLANLNPAGVIVSGLGFGALEAGAAAMQRDAGIPAVTVAVVEALMILLLAAVQIRARRAGPAVSTG